MLARTRKILRYYNVVLASASPRRAELIKKIPWLRAAVFPSEATEPRYAGGDVAGYAVSLSGLKARDVVNKRGGVVIGADTVVAVAGRVLGKPENAEDAEDMFRMLCGRVHEVITGYSVVSLKKSVSNFVVTSVEFGEFDSEMIGAYIRSGAPFDKAGGYGLQDAAIAPLIKKVDGDIDNVIGLPVQALEKTLKEFL